MNPSSSHIKNEKTKRFAASDINAHYQGKSSETKARTQQRYGLQKVGSVQGTRRLPQPVWVPSILSESGMLLSTSGTLSGSGSNQAGATAGNMQPPRPYSNPSQSEIGDGGSSGAPSTKWQKTMKAPASVLGPQHGFSGEDFPRLDEISTVTSTGGASSGIGPESLPAAPNMTSSSSGNPGFSSSGMRPLPGVDWMERRRILQLQKQQTTRSHSTEESCMGRTNSPRELREEEIADIKKLLFESDSHVIMDKSGPPPITRLQGAGSSNKFSASALSAAGQNSRIAFCQTAVSTEKEKTPIFTSSSTMTSSTTATSIGNVHSISTGRTMNILASVMPSNASGNLPDSGTLSRSDYFNTGWAAMDNDEEEDMTNVFGKQSSSVVDKGVLNSNQVQNLPECSAGGTHNTHDLESSGPNFDELLIFSDEEGEEVRSLPSGPLNQSSDGMKQELSYHTHPSANNPSQTNMESSGAFLIHSSLADAGTRPEIKRPSVHDNAQNWNAMQQRFPVSSINSDTAIRDTSPLTNFSSMTPSTHHLSSTFHQPYPSPMGLLPLPHTPPNFALQSGPQAPTNYRSMQPHSQSTPPSYMPPSIITSVGRPSFIAPRPYMPPSTWMPGGPSGIVPSLLPLGKKHDDEDEVEERTAQGRDIYWNAINRARSLRGEQIPHPLTSVTSTASGSHAPSSIMPSFSTANLPPLNTVSDPLQMTEYGNTKVETHSSGYFPPNGKSDASSAAITDWFECKKLQSEMNIGSESHTAPKSAQSESKLSNICDKSFDESNERPLLDSQPTLIMRPSSTRSDSLEASNSSTAQQSVTTVLSKSPSHSFSELKVTSHEEQNRDSTHVTSSEGAKFSEDKFASSKNIGRPAGRQDYQYPHIRPTTQQQDYKRNRAPAEPKQRSWRSGNNYMDEHDDYGEFSRNASQGRLDEDERSRGRYRFPGNRRNTSGFSKDPYSTEESYIYGKSGGQFYHGRRGGYTSGLTLSRSTDSESPAYDSHSRSGVRDRNQPATGRWESVEPTTSKGLSSKNEDSNVQADVHQITDRMKANSSRHQTAEEYKGHEDEESWPDRSLSRKKASGSRGRANTVVAGGRIFTRKYEKPPRHESAKHFDSSKPSFSKGKGVMENIETSKKDEQSSNEYQKQSGSGKTYGLETALTLPDTLDFTEGKVTPLFTESERMKLGEHLGGGVSATGQGGSLGRKGNSSYNRNNRCYDDYYGYSRDDNCWNYEYDTSKRGRKIASGNWAGYYYEGSYSQYDDKHYYSPVDYTKGDGPRTQHNRHQRNKVNSKPTDDVRKAVSSKTNPVQPANADACLEEQQTTLMNSDMPTSEGNEAEEWETASEGNEGAGLNENVSIHSKGNHASNDTSNQSHHRSYQSNLFSEGSASGGVRSKKPPLGHPSGHRPTFDSDTAGRQRAHYRNNHPKGGGGGAGSASRGSNGTSGGVAKSVGASTTGTGNISSGGNGGSKSPPPSTSAHNSSYSTSQQVPSNENSRTKQASKVIDLPQHNNNAVPAVTMDIVTPTTNITVKTMDVAISKTVVQRRPKLQVDTSVFSNVVLADSLPQVTEEELLMETFKTLMIDSQISSVSDPAAQNYTVPNTGVLGFQEVLSKNTKRTRKRMEEQAELQRRREESGPKLSSSKPNVASDRKESTHSGSRIRRNEPILPIEGPQPLLNEMELLSVQPMLASISKTSNLLPPRLAKFHQKRQSNSLTTTKISQQSNYNNRHRFRSKEDVDDSSKVTGESFLEIDKWKGEKATKITHVNVETSPSNVRLTPTACNTLQTSTDGNNPVSATGPQFDDMSSSDTWRHRLNDSGTLNTSAKHLTNGEEKNVSDFHSHQCDRINSDVAEDKLTPVSHVESETSAVSIMGQSGTATTTASNVCKVRPQQQQLSSGTKQPEEHTPLSIRSELIASDSVTFTHASISPLFFDGTNAPVSGVTQSLPSYSVTSSAQNSSGVAELLNETNGTSFASQQKFSSYQQIRNFAPISEPSWHGGLQDNNNSTKFSAITYATIGGGGAAPNRVSIATAASAMSGGFCAGLGTNLGGGMVASSDVSLSAPNLWNATPTNASQFHPLLRHQSIVNNGLPAPIARPSAVATHPTAPPTPLQWSGNSGTSDILFPSGGAQTYQPPSIWEMASASTNLSHPATAMLQHHQVGSGGTVSPVTSMLAAHLSLSNQQNTIIRPDIMTTSEPQHHRQHQNFMLAALYNPHPAAAPHSALFSGQQSVQTQNFLGGSHHELFTGANGGTARFSLSGQSVTPRTSIGPPRLATLPTAGQNPNQQHLFASTGNSNVKPVDFSGIPDVFGFSQSFPLQNQQSQSHHQGLFTHNSISSGIQSGVVTSTVSYRQHPNMHIEQPTTTPSLFGTPRLSTASHTSYQPAILTNPGAQQPSLSQHALLSSFNPSLTSTSAAAIYENPQMSGIVAESLAHLSQPELQNVILHMSKHGPLDASCLQQRIHLFSGSPMTPQQSLFPLEPISSFHGNPNSQVGNSRRPVSGYQHTCRQQMTPPSMPSGSTPVKYHKPLASAASSADTQHQSLQGGTETKTPVVEGPTHHTQMNSSQQILSRSSTASPSAACTAPIPSSLSTTTPLTSSE